MDPQKRAHTHTHTHTYGCTHKEIDTPAARKQRDRMSPTAVDSSKRKVGGAGGEEGREKHGGVGGGQEELLKVDNMVIKLHFFVLDWV